MAHHDSLTGLSNRAMFTDRLEHAFSRIKRSSDGLSVLYLDLDKFKQVNDQHGHHVGDGLLIEVAKRLKGLVRKEDTVARLGGDEFAILLESTSSEQQAIEVAKKVIGVFSLPISVAGLDFQCTTSIGVYFTLGDVGSAGIVLRNADKAMYKAKEAGRNRYCLYDQATLHQFGASFLGK
jgi:diguanylate cyclase (GGDEF)-like protein